MANETTTAPAEFEPGTCPFADLTEIAAAWKYNARESAAWALGWRQATTYPALSSAPGEDVKILHRSVLIRCSRDQFGALAAALIDAGAIVQTYSGDMDGNRTYRVSVS